MNQVLSVAFASPSWGPESQAMFYCEHGELQTRISLQVMSLAMQGFPDLIFLPASPLVQSQDMGPSQCQRPSPWAMAPALCLWKLNPIRIPLWILGSKVGSSRQMTPTSAALVLLRVDWATLFAEGMLLALGSPGSAAGTSENKGRPPAFYTVCHAMSF